MTVDQHPTLRPPPRPAEDLAAFDLAALASGPAVCAALVREARTRAGLTRAELARRAGVPEQVAELWEDPTWEAHSLEGLRRVARALGGRLELRLDLPRTRPEALTEPAAGGSAA